MSNALRFFLNSASPAIRVELADGSTTYATLRWDGTLTWHYGTPSERIEHQALEAILYDVASDFPSIKFGGFESLAEMDRQCSARCTTCRSVEASHDALSLHGECVRCWTKREAA
jgi:hypothetical protein